MVFGKTVPDISLNAVANLGYAEGRFLAPVYPGDTLSTTSTVIGLRQNKDGKSGVVYVRSIGVNQRGKAVLDYCRWVMVRKSDEARRRRSPRYRPREAVAAADLVVPADLYTLSTTRRSPAARTSGTTTPWARRSTMWTA